MKQTLIRLLAMAALPAFLLNAQFVAGKGSGYGPRDGSGYNHSGPKDGTGYGAKSAKGKQNGTGTCDQTGPKYNGQGRGQSQAPRTGRGGRR